MNKIMSELCIKTCFIFWIYLIIFALTAVNGQYSNLCDYNRLKRCQQDILVQIQESPSASQSGYSGISSGWQNSGQQSDQHLKCSAIRQSLDCLIMYTPSCQPTQALTSVSDSRDSGSDFIRRGRQYLERECERSGGGWKTSSCYIRSDIRQCETNYNNQVSTLATTTSCRNYQTFRDCVIRIVRDNCQPQDLQLMGTYLIDKGQELSWTCTLNPDYGSPSRIDSYPSDRNRYPNGGINQNQDITDRYGQPSGGYGQQYGGSGQPHGSSGQQYGSSGQQYGTSGQQYGGYGQQGSGQYGSNSGQFGSNYDGSQSGSIDRQHIGFPTTDSCLDRAGYFVRSCEDTLIQRQRDAREGRSSQDVQRRICCALFFYRDCISRVVVDRCRDPSPTVVDILMGSRKRDLTVTCREYSRDQCSGSLTIKASLTIFITIFLSFFLLK